VGHVVDQRERFDGWKVGVENEERGQGGRRKSGLQGGNRVRDSGRQQEILGEQRDGSW
jgi:hypothetical protein